jgi:hypothetical protein
LSGKSQFLFFSITNPFKKKEIYPNQNKSQGEPPKARFDLISPKTPSLTRKKSFSANLPEIFVSSRLISL